jgi:hypothetical protein
VGGRLLMPLMRAGKAPIRALHLDQPAPGDTDKVWYQGPGFWLERETDTATPEV